MDANNLVITKSEEMDILEPVNEKNIAVSSIKAGAEIASNLSNKVDSLQRILELKTDERISLIKQTNDDLVLIDADIENLSIAINKASAIKEAALNFSLAAEKIGNSETKVPAKRGRKPRATKAKIKPKTQK